MRSGRGSRGRGNHEQQLAMLRIANAGSMLRYGIYMEHYAELLFALSDFAATLTPGSARPLWVLCLRSVGK